MSPAGPPHTMLYIYVYLIPQTASAVGVLTVLLRGLDPFPAPSKAAGQRSLRKFTVLGDLTLKNTK